MQGGKNMKSKKIHALCLAGALSALAFAGCSSTQSSSSQTSSSSASEEAAGGKVTITMMYSGTVAENDFETQVLPELVKKTFPNITLEVTKLPDDQYYTALKTKLASGECADMVLVQPKYAGANSVIGLAKAGYLAPITDLKALENVSDSGKNSFTYNNEVYAVPCSVTILGTYYNKNIFKEHGLEVPKTWEEFLSCCETLKKAGIQPIVMGDKDMYVMQFGLYQIAASKVYPKNPSYDDDLRTGKTKFTDKDTWDKVLQMYYTLYEKGYISTSSLGLSAQQAIQKFIDGEAAMTFDGSFNAPAIKAKGAADFERGYFPLPGNESGEELYASMALGAGPAIYSGSKHIKECKQLMEVWYDGQSEIWKAFVDSGKVIPTYGYGSDKVDDLYKPFMELYNSGKSFYWCNQGWPSGVETEMESLFSEMVGGQGTTVEDIVKGMQTKFEELNSN